MPRRSGRVETAESTWTNATTERRRRLLVRVFARCTGAG
jgi:hypothetical protein